MPTVDKFVEAKTDRQLSWISFLSIFFNPRLFIEFNLVVKLNGNWFKKSHMKKSICVVHCYSVIFIIKKLAVGAGYRCQIILYHWRWIFPRLKIAKPWPSIGPETGLLRFLKEPNVVIAIYVTTSEPLTCSKLEHMKSWNVCCNLYNFFNNAFKFT